MGEHGAMKFKVQQRHALETNWTTIGLFPDYFRAKEYAQWFADRYSTARVRLIAPPTLFHGNAEPMEGSWEGK